MKKIILCFFIILLLIMGIVFLTTNNTSNKVEKYLKGTYKDDTFSDITFIESGEYIVRKAHWWGDGGTSLKKDGTFTRYKVHSNKENIDFFVQYLSSTKKMEDNLVITRDKRDIQEKLSEIFNKYLVNVSDIYYMPDSTGQNGVLEDVIPDLAIEIDQPLNEFCKKEFADKIKMIKNEINLYFINNTYYKNYRYWFFNIRIISDECTIRFETHAYYNESMDEFSISTNIFVKEENAENINFETFKAQILKNFDENDDVYCYKVKDVKK